MCKIFLANFRQQNIARWEGYNNIEGMKEQNVCRVDAAIIEVRIFCCSVDAAIILQGWGCKHFAGWMLQTFYRVDAANIIQGERC